MHHAWPSIWIVLALVCAAAAQAQAAPPGAGEVPQEIIDRAKLGRRVLAVERAVPVIDRVVLVPDDDTYLDEIARWSLEGRWPVLFESDAYFASMFIRRFRPAQVVRRESVGGTAEKLHAWRRRVDHALVAAWGGDPAAESPDEVFERLGHVPPGIVLAGAGRDAAWTAAVALAAGRVQPLLWLDGNLGTPGGGPMDEKAVRELRERVRKLAASTGYGFDASGDAIETVTICREMAGRCRFPRPDTRQVENIATTDVLGRDQDERRWAYVGWIFGPRDRAAYIAMCSLFLPRERVWLCDTYPETQNFSGFGVHGPARALRERGFEATVADRGGNVTSGWRRNLSGGLSTDVVLMNTRGNRSWFLLFDEERAAGLDVPVLNEPAVVHFVHSWSMAMPDEPGTIATEWLERGAYAYVGSMQEPMLAAFVPPSMLVMQWVNLIPFLPGARHWNAPAPFGGPWRVNLFGDPLMLCAPPDVEPRPRLEPGDPPRGVSLRVAVEQRMREAAAEPSVGAFGEAVRWLVLLGRDELAIETWRLARQHDASALASTEVLGALFRAERLDDFVAAYDDATSRPAHAVTMLWHLLLWRLQQVDDPDTLLLLQSSLRDPPLTDLERLAPRLAAVFGSDHVRRVILRELDTDPGSEEAMRKMLERYR